MQRFVHVFLVFSFLMICNLSFAQTANSSSTDIETSETLLNLNNDDWSFFIDEESQTYYIDFETINVNLSDVIVTSDSGEVLLKDSVVDLPVNTIYEIDFSEYGAGHYEIELRSYTGSIGKAVDIR